MCKVKIDDLIVFEGHEYRILGLGIEREDGMVYAHLASTTVKLKQKNGSVFRQIATSIPSVKRDEAVDGIVDGLKAALDLFEKGHAIDAFDWGGSCLAAEHIRELNETPGKIRRALRLAEAL